MAEQEKIRIGVSDSTFVGDKPLPNLVKNVFFPSLSIRKARDSALQLGLDGLQIAWRRGLFSDKVERIIKPCEVLAVHGEIWATQKQAEQESQEHNTKHGSLIKFMPIVFGYFHAGHDSDTFARSHQAYLVLHPGTFINLVRTDPLWRLYQRDYWLMEPDWQRPEQRSQEIFISNPLAAALIAKKYGIKCLFNTSHTGITRNELEGPWRIYCQELETPPPAIHFSAWVYQTCNAEEEGGLDVSNPDRLGRSYDLLGNFFTRRVEEKWQGTIIIELSFSTSRGQNADEKVYGMVEFLKGCGIKPQKS